MSFLVMRGIELECYGRHEDALECYNTQLASDPDDAVTWAVKAACLLRLERHQESHDCRSIAHYLDPERF